LAQAAQVSPGTVSKTLPLLVAEDAIQRNAHGKITAVDRRAVLNRWTLDYQVLSSNGTPSYFVAPRGLCAVLAAMTTVSSIALTGGHGGALWLPAGTAPIIPATHLVAYTTDTAATAFGLGLVPTDAPSANIIMLTAQDRTILDNPERHTDLPDAPLP
jgi:hypothetical protein